MVRYNQRIKGNEVASEMSRRYGWTFSVIHDSFNLQNQCSLVSNKLTDVQTENSS